MCKYLDKLNEITPELPEVPNLNNFKNIGEGITEYRFKKGTAISFNLFNDKDISIARTFIPKMVKFDNHKHEGYEIIIVLKGELDIIMSSGNIRLKQYQDIKIDKTVPHAAKAIKDTWIIALTIPNDDGFPK